MGKKITKPAAKKEAVLPATADAEASQAPEEAPSPVEATPATPEAEPVAPAAGEASAPVEATPATPEAEPVAPAAGEASATVDAPSEIPTGGPVTPADAPQVSGQDGTGSPVPPAPAPAGELIGENGLPIDVDDDEVLDEIRPTAKDEGKKPSPEQFKKDFTKNQVEAVLFVSGQAVSAEEVAVKLNVGKKVIEEALDKLAMEYIERSTALEIAKVADKYILQLKPEFTSSVKSFATGGLIREAVMRTLTIIAAKQPILQSDLSKIRSSAGEHLKELTEMGLVKAVPKGRSKELTTTDKFADMFGFSRDVNQMKEQIKIYLTAATKDDGE